jgi:hypothetical protein
MDSGWRPGLRGNGRKVGRGRSVCCVITITVKKVHLCHYCVALIVAHAVLDDP